MIDPTRDLARQANVLATVPPSATMPGKPVFRMIASDRMGGSVPAWVRPSSAQDATLSTLGAAGGNAKFADELKNTMAYREPAGAAPGNINDEPFGFGDLVDIINPLQHIPLVNHLYRKITGDQIRPSSSIIGGAVFGGVAGVAGSLANVIIKEESGNDFTEHALNMAGVDRYNTPPQPPEETPLERLANVDQQPQLPHSALGFLDMTYRSQTPPETIPAPRATQATAARVAAMYKFNS